MITVKVDDDGGVANGGVDSAVTSFAVTVNAVSDTPAARDDSITTPEDTAVTVFVLVNDSDEVGDALTVASVSQPAHGTAAIDAGDTTLTYTPVANFWGADSLIYAVSDGQSGLDTARVRVTVTPVNDPPETFALISPGNDSTLVITNDNVESDTLIFSWEAATDADGDSVIYYGDTYNGELWELHIPFGEAPGNEARVSYENLASTLANLGQLTITGTWDIFATDGEDSTWSSNGPFTLTVDVTTLDVLWLVVLPKEFALHPNYPNPFNPLTTIRYDLPEAAEVLLVVYDLRGKEVRTLIKAAQSPGIKTAAWDGRDAAGTEVSTGIYIARLVTPEFTKSIKMVLLK